MLVIQFIIGFILGVIIFLGGMHFYAKYAAYEKKSQCPNILIQMGSKYYLLNSNMDQIPGVNPLEFRTLEEYNEFLKWQKTVGIKCPVLYVQKTYDAQGNRVYKMRPSVNDPKGGLPPSSSPHVSEPDYELMKASSCGQPYIDISGSNPHTSIGFSLWDMISTPNVEQQPIPEPAQTKPPIPTETKVSVPSSVPKKKNTYDASIPKVEYPANLSPCPIPEFKTLSDDPMDTNWGGEDYTEKSVRSGKYAGSEVMLPGA
jgi:hypothetical protein